MLTQRTRVRRGFTLVELIIVMGIIVALAAILLPVLSSVRQSAYAANTQQLIVILSNSIDRYRQDYGAYPGPLANDPATRTAVSGVVAANVTMTENMMLGLFGGLANVSGTITYDPAVYTATSGKFLEGPRSLNANMPKKQAAYLALPAGEFANVGNGNDTVIPEIQDRFLNDGRAILYLRANRGAPGIVSNTAPNFQYTLNQITPYTVFTGSKHGLQGLGTYTPPVNAKSLDAVAYLRNPKFPPTDPANENASGTPMQKDGFILISAGKDRIYGTNDDITNFGAIGGS